MMVMTINWYGNDKEDGGDGSGDFFLHICAICGGTVLEEVLDLSSDRLLNE
jgi:hypothetical protein